MQLPRDQKRRERVEHIADLIRNLKFRYGETYKALSREWDVSYDYVRNLGAEAHEIVRGEIVDVEITTVNVCVTLEQIMVRAFNSSDYGSAVAAAREWGRLAYAHTDRRHANAGATVSSKEQTKAMLVSLLAALESANE